jgi:hypothetical protein
MKPIKVIFSILLIFQNFAGISQSNDSSTATDSVSNEYLRSIDTTCKIIDSLILENAYTIRIDTLELKTQYYVKENDHSLLTKSLDHKEETPLPLKTVKAIVVSLNKKVLKISIPSKFRSAFGTSNFDIYYFSDKQLISSVISCSEPFDRVGSCGGLFSTYYNYFLQNEFYHLKVVENEIIGFCGCGFDYIPLKSSLDFWMIEIETYFH